MTRRWAQRAVACGAAVLVVTAVISIWNPRESCGPPSGTPPIIAFEFAVDAKDLAAVFGPPGECRDALAEGFRIVNRLDYAFLLAYGAFLYAALRAASRGSSTVAALGLAAALAAPVADAIENVGLLSLDLDAPGAWLTAVAIAVRVKFALLGAWSAAFAFTLARGEPSRLRLLAAVPAVAAPVIWAALIARAAVPALTPAIIASWLVGLI